VETLDHVRRMPGSPERGSVAGKLTVWNGTLSLPRNCTCSVSRAAKALQSATAFLMHEAAGWDTGQSLRLKCCTLSPLRLSPPATLRITAPRVA
jgi:hypothetical protein